MINYEQFHQIKALQASDLTAGQIALQTQISENTVRLWMKRERYEPKRSSRPRSSKLDPYKPHIAQLRHECEALTAVQIFAKLQQDGYQGSYTLVRQYVRTVHPKRRKTYADLVFVPGEAGQVDFGECGLTEVGNTRRKLYVFVMVLCHSRLMYVEFILRQNLEHFLSCHRRAFEFFGGVPRATIVDRTKCAILGNDPLGKPIPNARYYDMSRHYSFEIRACDAYCPNQKGRVEAGVKFVKGNFWRGRGIEPFEVVKAAAVEWMDAANRRVHRRTKQRPIDCYQTTERPAMQALPLRPYDCSVVVDKLVDKQARFSFDGNRYSVPPQYAPGKITLHVLPESLTAYCDGNLIAKHVRCFEKRADPIVDPDHQIQFRKQQRRSKDRKALQHFLALGHVAVEYYQQLQLRSINELSHVRKILALTEYHDRQSVLRALADANAHCAFSAEYIANLLQFRSQLDEPSPLHLPGKQDLLDLELPDPDLDIYDQRLEPRTALNDEHQKENDDGLK